MRALCILGLTLLSLVLLSPVRAELVEPPFVRQWTQLTGERSAVIAVRNGLVLYSSNKGVGALDLSTGQRQWALLTDHSIALATLWDQTLYAISQTGESSNLLAINTTTQQSRVLARLGPSSTNLAVDPERLYVLDGSTTLRAYDRISGAALWTRKLGATGTSLSQLQITSDALYVALDEAGEYGVDPKDGRVLWQRRSEYAATYKPIVVGQDVITQGEGIQRLNVRSGRVVWKIGGVDGEIALVANVLISSNEKEFVGYDVTSATVLWRLPLRDQNTTYTTVTDEDIPFISDGESVWIMREPVVCVTKDGREKWHLINPFNGTPVYADSGRIVTLDDSRILSYRAGALPPLPSSDEEKRALAERLSAQFELLDDVERRQLTKLVPFSFAPLLARYTTWAKSSDAEPEDESGYTLYSLLTDAIPILHATARTEDTAALVQALPNLDAQSEWRAHLEQILQSKGDPAGYIPVLVENLRRLPENKREPSAALSAVSSSSHPQAVALMLQALRDPKAAPAWRQEAFQHLAGTGGDTGVEAVRRARPRRSSRMAWFERINVAKLRQDAIVGTKRDAKGRTWMLFHSAVLGNHSDLFIVQKLGAKWGKPLFTGAWTGRTFRSEAPKAFRGIPIAKLVQSEWIRIFPTDASIQRDSDRDRLTDVVEARLSTNPRKADTDSDNLLDTVDPCPNAAPRPLGDTEKIIAACIEARFFEENWGVPALLSAENVKPFELYGYAPVVIWQTAQRGSFTGHP
jgi:outer membrane protein assembly factor BamB